MKYSFYTVDVFTNKPFNGAQIAVLPDAGNLSDKQMQLVAREFNLSETVFLSNTSEFNSASGTNGSPEEEIPNIRNIRVFSPLKELDIGGHTTLAAAYVLMKTCRIESENPETKIKLEQKNKSLDVVASKSGDNDYFIQFSSETSAIVDRYVPVNEHIAQMLSLQEADIEKQSYRTFLVACEQAYLIVPLRSFELVRKAVFDYSAWGNSIAPVVAASEIMLVAPQSDITSSNFHARLVGPSIGVNEDPPIGSAMPAFSGYLCAHEHIKYGTHTFTIDRGTLATRKSVLNIEMDYHQNRQNVIRVGGPAVLISEGKISV